MLQTTVRQQFHGFSKLGGKTAGVAGEAEDFSWPREKTISVLHGAQFEAAGGQTSHTRVLLVFWYLKEMV